METLLLENLNLRSIPDSKSICENASDVRVLLVQNNFISSVSNVNDFKNLVVLDINNNKLNALIGIESLSNLSILMAGSNLLKSMTGNIMLRIFVVICFHFYDITSC
jgi:Leucine-rich repeat (LRR) protein